MGIEQFLIAYAINIVVAQLPSGRSALIAKCVPVERTRREIYRKFSFTDEMIRRAAFHKEARL